MNKALPNQLQGPRACRKEHQLPSSQRDDDLGRIRGSTSDVLDVGFIGRPPLYPGPSYHIHNDYCRGCHLYGSITFLNVARRESSFVANEPGKVRILELLEGVGLELKYRGGLERAE